MAIKMNLEPLLFEEDKTICISVNGKKTKALWSYFEKINNKSTQNRKSPKKMRSDTIPHKGMPSYAVQKRGRGSGFLL